MWPLVVLMLMVDAVNLETTCPNICVCEYFIVDCKYNGLADLPENVGSDVISLDLAYNNFEQIPSEMRRLTDLRYLNFSHNKIATVMSSDLQYLKKLERIDFSFNSFRTWTDIQSATFNIHKNLMYLDVSSNPLASLTKLSSHFRIESLQILRLANCSMNNIPANVFNRLINLKELHLGNNHVTYFNESLVLSKLMYLDLSQNNLKHIAKHAFANSTSLETLILNGNLYLKSLKINSRSLLFIDLSNCTLEKLPEGDLRKLTSLNLSNNFLKTIYNRGLTNFEALEYLDISVNSISTIEEQAFSGLGKLRFLDLSYNKITKFEEKTFEITKNLIKLNVSHTYLHGINSILSVPLKYLDASYCEIYSMDRLALYGMPNLISLNLSRNFLSSLPDALYSKSLIYLDVSSCRIKSINNRTFEEMDFLRTINLAGNLLTTIDPSFFPKVHSLDISNNQWRCDCPKLKKMYDQQSSSTSFKERSLICDSPESVEGLSWREVCISEWDPVSTKKDSLWWYSVGVVLCMVALLVGVIIVRRLHKLKEKRLQQVEETRRAEERETLRRMQRLQREFQQEADRNAPDPRDAQRPPSYNEALLMPRMDASTQSLQSIASRGSNTSEKGIRKKRKRRKKSDSRRSSRVVVDDSTDEDRPRPALESDF